MAQTGATGATPMMAQYLALKEEAGDCLLGVTMQPGGSSRVIVERASAASA